VKTKIFTLAQLPTELAQAWLQHLRDFDTAHPDCHFEIFADVPDGVSMADVVEMVKVHPDLTFQQIFDREMKQAEIMRKSLRESGLKIGGDDD
jgi:hypothetical protein